MNKHALLVLALFGLGSAPVSGNGSVSVIHGIPGVTVDVYVNEDLTLGGFEPGTVTDPLSLPAGDYALAITLPDAPIEDAILTGSATVTDGSNVSVVAHLDADGAPTISLFANDVSEARKRRGRLIVRHVAAAPAVDVDIAWRRWRLAEFEGVENGDEGSKDLYRTSYNVSLRAAGTRDRVFGPASVSVSEGEATIVYAIGSLADETFGVLVQTLDLESPPAMAKVSVVHGVPGLTVDVYLNGGLALEGFEPDTITDRLDLPAGDYDIAISPAGASIDDAVITASATVPEGADVTVVAHLAADGTPTITPFVNNLSSTRIFRGRVLVRHAAAAPAVDISLVRGRWFDAELSDLSNGEEAGADLFAGRYHATIFAAEGDAEVAGPVSVKARPRRATIIYAVGSLADGTFKLLTQTLPLSRYRH